MPPTNSPRFLVACSVTCALAGLAAPARAETTSVLTAGAGAHVAAAAEPRGAPNGAFVFAAGVSFRLHLWQFLGAEVEYTLGTPLDSARTRMSLSAIVYPVPLESFGLYLKAGASGTDLNHLVRPSDPDTHFHAGLGLEVRVYEHWVAAAELRAAAGLEYGAGGDTVRGAHLDTIRAAAGLRHYF